MIGTTKAEILSTISIALLLACGSSGCHTPNGMHRNSLAAGEHRLCPRRARPVVPDPMPYGYYQTCWHPWPDPCVGHPLDVIEVESDLPLNNGSNADATLERLPEVPEPDDWETLPVPPGDPTPVDDREMGLPLENRGESDLVPPPGETETPIEDADPESPSETDSDAAPAASEDVPLGPSSQGGSRRDATLKIVGPPRRVSRRNDGLVQPATFLRWCPKPRGGDVASLDTEIRGRGIVQVEVFLPAYEAIVDAESPLPPKPRLAQQRSPGRPAPRVMEKVARNERHLPVAERSTSGKKAHFLSK